MDFQGELAVPDYHPLCFEFVPLTGPDFVLGLQQMLSTGPQMQAKRLVKLLGPPTVTFSETYSCRNNTADFESITSFGIQMDILA